MTTENLKNNVIDPMNLPIIDRGFMFVKNPAEHEKHKRMTKQELHEFVRWSFKHVDDENWSTLSNAHIANLYFQETGKHINRVTVGRNRYNWFMKDGKIVRYDG